MRKLVLITYIIFSISSSVIYHIIPAIILDYDIKRNSVGKCVKISTLPNQFCEIECSYENVVNKREVYCNEIPESMLTSIDDKIIFAIAYSEKFLIFLICFLCVLAVLWTISAALILSSILNSIKINT